MATNFELFKKQLDDAVGIIEKTALLENTPINSLVNRDLLVDTKSLLSRCEQVAKKYEKAKPTIRIIHHLACSGGTLVSKCIASMPNVYLLSEVHPFTDLGVNLEYPQYAPSDIISLSKYANIPKQKELAAKIFKKSIDEVYQHVNEIGGILVLRDHTHADFNTTQRLPEKSAIIELLEESYSLKTVLTIRDPIDSYSSLVKNNWVHFTPSNFDEYCRRLISLLQNFSSEKIFKYEDFVKKPDKNMRLITSALDIPFDEMYSDIFSVFKITGDSGRVSNTISERSSMANADVVSESQNSEHYKHLQTLISY